MRRLILVMLVLGLAAPAAYAERRAVGDGSLVVSGASARVIMLRGSGLIYGHIQQGSLTVLDYNAADTNAPQISGAASRIVGGAVVYSGSDFRFLFSNGTYTLRIDGTGIDISAVGRGTVVAVGLGTADDGSLTVNSGKPLPLTTFGTSAFFGATAAPPVVTAAASPAPAAPGLSLGHGRGRG